VKVLGETPVRARVVEDADDWGGAFDCDLLMDVLFCFLNIFEAVLSCRYWVWSQSWEIRFVVMLRSSGWSLLFDLSSSDILPKTSCHVVVIMTDISKVFFVPSCI